MIIANPMNRLLLLFPVFVMLFLAACKAPTATSSSGKETISIVIPEAAPARIKFGAERLEKALASSGYQVRLLTQTKPAGKDRQIVLGQLNSSLIQQAAAAAGIRVGATPGKEGFVINSGKKITLIGGADASGVLYGCLALADQVQQQGVLPAALQMTDQPEMVLRGASIGMQKTVYLPGRTVYEYPYTQEEFPWFYDKQHWIEYLDMLVDNRMNSLYLWNGHPFASLVKLKDYPYALEVDEATFKKNEEVFRFLTEEADKRGIWVIQMFYNIIVSKPFAEKHGIKTQDRKRPIIPVIADYTRKSIAAFVEKYPNVGLLITLGEAMEGDENDVEWFTKTIIPGVQDGLKALGTTTEPPLVLRGHDTNPQMVMAAALPMYKNLYTMLKYNGESLMTYEPRGPWAQTHRDLANLGSTHVENVHVLANLEPFRYGSADFIQKSIKAMHRVHQANGLHLYPQASYWDWPYTADKTTPRLKQIDRDWIWYKAWARYAWKANRDRKDEIAYWGKLLGGKYGCGPQGENILEAYEQIGEIAPKLLRRFGISDGNRQTLTLGMFMSQLVNPYKFTVYATFHNSHSPEGEILLDYAEKEWHKKPHVGETPPQIASEVVQHGRLAVAAIEKAAPHVTKDKDEFLRLQNDVYCYQALANFFAEKAKAAMLVLRYNHSGQIQDLEAAVPHLEKSLTFYQELVKLTKEAYLYANSMQTQQRRIPIGGDGGKNKTWAELMPHYQQELVAFKKNILLLKSPASAPAKSVQVKALAPAKVTLPDNQAPYYKLAPGQQVFGDKALVLKAVAPELKGLQGLQLSWAGQVQQGTTLHFKNDKPVKVLVGYFRSKDKGILTAPNLEIDASANDYGQAEVILANALVVQDMPPVNVHAYHFGAGDHTLALGKGACLILGFVEGKEDIAVRDAGFNALEYRKGVDWLFD